MKIKEVADKIGISVMTIKRHEKTGGIPEPSRDKWGHRDYTEMEAKTVIEYFKGLFQENNK